MLANIVDNRENPYSGKMVNVVMEPAFHDNSVPGSDKYEVADDAPSCLNRNGLSMQEAVEWAMNMSFPMTIYIYDAHVDPMGV